MNNNAFNSQPSLHPIDEIEIETEDFTPTAAEIDEAAKLPRFAGWHRDDIASDLEYEARKESEKWDCSGAEPEEW